MFVLIGHSTVKHNGGSMSQLKSILCETRVPEEQKDVETGTKATDENQTSSKSTDSARTL
jgi:hypothetical protein